MSGSSCWKGSREGGKEGRRKAGRPWLLRSHQKQSSEEAMPSERAADGRSKLMVRKRRRRGNAAASQSLPEKAASEAKDGAAAIRGTIGPIDSVGRSGGSWRKERQGGRREGGPPRNDQRIDSDRLPKVMRRMKRPNVYFCPPPSLPPSLSGPVQDDDDDEGRKLIIRLPLLAKWIDVVAIE